MSATNAMTTTVTETRSPQPPQSAGAVHAANAPGPQAAGAGNTVASQHGAPAKLQKFPKPPVFSDKFEEREYLKGRLALAFRLFASNGYEEGVAGHITLRDPVKPGHFWVNPFGVPFGHIRKSDLILVDSDGNVVDGGANRLLNVAAYMIHSAVHEARPDVLCAAHCHSLYGRTFSTLGREIDIITQDSCAFYKDHSVYTSFKGVVLAKEEGLNIASALGKNKAVILQNHGLLTVGQTIEGCIFWFNTLESCCKTQLLADAAAAGRGGRPIEIDDEDAEFTFKTIGTPQAGWFAGQPPFAVLERQFGSEVFQ
ncbi:meiotically up-regulated 14 protein [Purpureocillium lavendulum]|uniref:Meiotically up-regulated 14 protein n=1 Tax=Purpureocillium lavendulum TaxID=1247861 RepID=A0AB34G293_9HYPO|nr:meiotically up-regulated 14 protein [Purpureocillium lavendulum]